MADAQWAVANHLVTRKSRVPDVRSVWGRRPRRRALALDPIDEDV